MKKKAFITFAVALCVLICLCSFVGCSKPTGAEEFNAFKQKIITVLNDNGMSITQLNDGTANIVTPTAKYVSTNNVDKIKEFVVGDSAVKSNAQRVDEIRQEMYEQALFISLIVGDGMVNNHNADTIYDTSVLVDCWWKTYMEFKTSGTVTTINTYSPALNGECAYAGVVYLDYKSKDDYNFVMLVTWEDGRMGYRYGNSQKQFVYFDYDQQGNYSEIYCSSKAEEGYISQDTEVVKSCFELVKEQFVGMEVKDYEYLTEQKYTIDEEEWETLCAKYFPNDGDQVGSGEEQLAKK
ncbi:MAG: hypothetical protein K2L61_01230 [Clostridia bacterium]|nr:hypothetical protein [Clostridia bacterium]